MTRFSNKEHDKFADLEVLKISFNRSKRVVSKLVYDILAVIAIVSSCYVISKKHKNVNIIRNFVINTKNEVIVNVNNILNDIDGKKFKIKEKKGFSYSKQEKFEQIVEYIMDIDINGESKIQLIKSTLLEIPTIKNVVVKRYPLRGVEVLITEIDVFTYFIDQFSGKTYIVDNDLNARICEGCRVENYNISQVKGLSIDDLDDLQSFHSALQSCPEVLENAILYERIASNRWNVTLGNNAKILLPSGINSFEFDKICNVLKDELPIFDKKSSLSVDYVDARIKDRVYYRMK